MVAEALRDTTISEPVKIDPPISEALFRGRENSLPTRAQELVTLIESLSLPTLASDRALLVAFYYFSLGAEDAVDTLRTHFGNDVEDRLGISFTKRGTLERPGMNSLIERACGNLSEEFRILQRQLTPIDKPVKKHSNGALVLSL